MRNLRNLSVVMLLASLLALGGAGVERGAAAAEHASTFAAPWAIIAHGPFLEKSIVMANWEENQAVMLAASEPAPSTQASELVRRPYVALALFWGPEWKHLRDAPAAVARLEPKQANQHARFFPADGDSPAILVMNMSTVPASGAQLDIRSVDAKGLVVLLAHGIPIRLAR